MTNPHSTVKEKFNIYSTAEDNLSIIISYRGDVEPNIGSIWQKISGSPQGLPRTYLGPLQKNNAKHVIAGNLEALHINLKDARGNEQLLLDILVDDLESESLMNGYSGVYPPFIQMVIARIFQDKENNSYRSQKYYEAGQSRKIISDYLMNQLKYLGKNIDSGKKVLVALVSSYGTKAQKTLEEIATEALLPRSGIEMILNSLIDLRLVRNIEGTYEISHDFLARTITSELVSVDKRETKKYKELIASRAAAYSSTKAALTKAEHMYIYKFRNMMLLTDQEIKLLLLSYLLGNGPISYWAKRVPIPKLKSWANEFALDETNEVKQAVCNFLIRIGEPPQLFVFADAFSDYKQQHQLSRHILDFGTIEDIGLLMVLNRRRTEDVVNASRDALVRLIEPEHQAILQEIMPVMAPSKRLQTVKMFEAVAMKVGETSALNSIREGLSSRQLWQQLLSIYALSSKGQREDLSELRHMMQKKMPNKLRTAIRKTIVRLELRLGEPIELNKYIYSGDKSTVREALDAINIPSDLELVRK